MALAFALLEVGQHVAEAMVCNHGCYLNISGALRVLQVTIQISKEQWGRPIGKAGESPLDMFHS